VVALIQEGVHLDFGIGVDPDPPRARHLRLAQPIGGCWMVLAFGQQLMMLLGVENHSIPRQRCFVLTARLLRWGPGEFDPAIIRVVVGHTNHSLKTKFMQQKYAQMATEIMAPMVEWLV